MPIDRAYVVAGFAWLSLGMVFGMYLGGTDQLNFANSHAHANLLGFVLSILFALLYRTWPAMLESRLALPQFLLHQIGTLVLVAAKASIDSGGSGLFAPPGSIVVLCGTLLFFVIFLRGSRGGVPARRAVP